MSLPKSEGNSLKEHSLESRCGACGHLYSDHELDRDDGSRWCMSRLTSGLMCWCLDYVPCELKSSE